MPTKEVGTKENVIKTRDFKGHFHPIWQLYKKLGVFASVEQLNSRTNDLVVIEDYFKVLKLLLVGCRSGWHRWKWVEI